MASDLAAAEDLTTGSKSRDSKESGFSFDNRSAMMVGTLHNKGDGSGATDTVTGTKLSVGGSATLATQTGNITLKGANVVSEDDLSISAARNLTITSAQDTAQNANKSDDKAVAKVVVSDTERFAGYHDEKHNDNSNQVTQVASNIGSLPARLAPAHWQRDPQRRRDGGLGQPHAAAQRLTAALRGPVDVARAGDLPVRAGQ
ncbi:hemagglutinin repeat-containing protein [Massilia sp. 9096]|uniref:hemagglutinin repeat-containing protein n=1 Tax=Massilia sp. 9096 TaxID=1500894 RepID=UPI0018CEE98A|nr:hemagglutinin repeat-containing protein [Massilia sp. 9096]